MSERPVFIVEDFLLVSQTKATVTLCGPLSVVQKLCPIGALVELREAPSDHPMAWDFAARMDARKAGVSCTVERRAASMRDWYRKQLDKVLGVEVSTQLALFAHP